MLRNSILAVAILDVLVSTDEAHSENSASHFFRTVGCELRWPGSGLNQESGLRVLVENAEFYATHEDPMTDAGHINTGGKRVNGDGCVCVSLLLATQNQRINFVTLNRDFSFG